MRPKYYLSYLFVLLFGINDIPIGGIDYKNSEFKKGTLILAGAGSDGIIIAADSRISHVGANGKGGSKVLSYNDSCQKIFIIKGVPIAISGQFEFNKIPAHEFIKAYNENTLNEGKKDIDIYSSFLNDFFLAFPVSDNPFLSKNYFVSGGFRNDTAIILKGRYGDFWGRPNAIISSDSRVNPFLVKYLPDSLYRKVLTCKQLQAIFTKVFIDFGENYSGVGGPISIIKIKPDNSYSWIQNDFSKKPLGESARHPIPLKDSAKWNEWLNQK